MNATLDHMKTADLILLAQAGNDKALEELFKGHLSSIYGTCLRILRNPDEAQDAVQESFIKIWKNLGRIDLKKNFRVWAIEIAKNTCLDMVKRRRTVPMSAFDDENGNNFIVDTLRSPSPSPSEAAELSLLKRLLHGAVSRLSPAYQRVLRMYYDDGLNFREIAEKLDEPMYTVKSRHRRAIINLRLILAENQ
jgi:RNA polymerase sigma-70 factor, ECF subfamily